MASRPADRIAHIELPPPRLTGPMSLEETLARRRSIREFSPHPLTDQEISQLLWSAQGITYPEGDRTAPSAGGLQPLEVWVASSAGLFRYEPRHHRLRVHARRDLREAIFRAGLLQDPLVDAPAVFLVAAIYQRTTRKYGRERSPRYIHMEAGHAAQNLLLQAVALDLGAVVIGAFEDEELQRALALPADQRPLYLIPVGHPR